LNTGPTTKTEVVEMDSTVVRREVGAVNLSIGERSVEASRRG
jgi:hypothetical protein